MATKTKDWILECALTLFNEQGEPNTTTNAIATEADISPGNLYYHFHSKQDIVEALFEAYEQRLLDILVTPPDRAADLDDIWLLLHLSFELMGHYQFIYRDLTDLCTRYPKLHHRFMGIMRLAKQTATLMADDLIDSGIMVATKNERDAMIENILLISNFWLANDRIRSPKGAIDPARAVAQTIEILKPFLIPPARELLAEIGSRYH